jgi:hypothetical protein
MTNSRSASNAWAKIKKKLITTDGDAPPSTPTKKAATPRKKRTPKAVDENGEPPKKSTPRKRPAKKQEVEDGDVSPKKKSRAAKGKKSEEIGELPTDTACVLRTDLSIVDESDDVDPPVKSEDEADATNDELTVKAEVEEDENEA